MSNFHHLHLSDGVIIISFITFLVSPGEFFKGLF